MPYDKDIVDRVPAPDKFPGGSRGSDEDDAAEPEGEAEDEAKAARVSQMQEFLDILGLKGVDAEAACEALDQYFDIR